MHWREYHEATKHTQERLRRSTHTLDWDNMPDPFRHYEGVPLLDLPADPPAPEIPMLDVLRGESGASQVEPAAALLSSLLFYSAAISASKAVPSTGYRYALRVNPSSGNLHPTEFHLAARDGLFHYRPSSHMLEVRGKGAFSPGPLTVLLTSIAWREAWKYQDRAYRYCLLDAGHAWMSVELAAHALGFKVRVNGDFDDDAVAREWALASDEWPLLQLEIADYPAGGPGGDKRQIIGGLPNQLSAVVVPYPRIDRIHTATKRPSENRWVPSASPGESPVQSSDSLAAVTRRRRSALDFTGAQISAGQFRTLVSLAASISDYVELYAYVHQVDGLEPGVYRWRRGSLDQVKRGDQRIVAAGLSLTQQLAGTSAVTFSMIANLERAARDHGDRGYRYAHFEAGAIGQRLYLAAEAMGFHSTGIGAFFDDEVHRYLDISPEEGQVIYHFACGHAVRDPRLTASPG